jgi:hypothetical protein
MGESGTDFRALQFEFTAHIRDPEKNPAPQGIEDRRLAIYRDLLYRNIEGFLANSFPVLRSIVVDEQWHAMVRRYFADHRARTPLFPKLPQEFLHYLADERNPDDGAPFMQELAHYEWLELEASLDKRDIDDSAVDENANCLAGVPVLNPIARAHSYHFPVHRISPSFQPLKAGEQPTYLVVYRDRADKVGFMQLNPIAARLIDLIAQGSDIPGRKLLLQIAEEIAHPDPEVVVSGGVEVIAELCQREVLLGAREALA